MKKFLLFLLNLACFNLFCADSVVKIEKPNSARIAIYQEQLTNEIEKNKIFSYGTTAVLGLIASYAAFKILKGKPATVVEDAKSKMEELLKLYQEGKIALTNQGFWANLKANWFTTIGIQAVSVGATAGSHWFQSKLFKNYDINFILREKTKIQFLFTSLKQVFAILDNQSTVFAVKFPFTFNLAVNGQTQAEANDEQQADQMMQSLNIKESLQQAVLGNSEIFALKVISATASNMSALDLGIEINKAVSFYNYLMRDMEQVFAFMKYQADKFKQENKPEEHDKVKQLTEELKVLVEFSHLKFLNGLKKVERDGAVTDDIGLLSEILSFQRTFTQIIGRMP